jgi:hypothetical protein
MYQLSVFHASITHQLLKGMQTGINALSYRLFLIRFLAMPWQALSIPLNQDDAPQIRKIRNRSAKRAERFF